MRPQSCLRSLPQEYKTIQLPDSRTLGYAVYGLQLTSPESSSQCHLDAASEATPNGTILDSTSTIIYCHGVPGTRLEAYPLHRHALSIGVRIIAIDRPGIGLSSSKMKRTVLDFAEDVLYLLSHLHIRQVYILAYSGGSPYGLGLAYALASYRGKTPYVQLLGLGVVAGLAPWYIAGPTLGPLRRLVACLAYSWPSSGRYILASKPCCTGQADAKSNIEAGIVGGEKASQGPGVDIPKKPMEVTVSAEKLVEKETLNDREEARAAFHRNIDEAYRRDVSGMVQDLVLMVSHWGFELSDVSKSMLVLGRKGNEPAIKMWYGGRDANVPLVQGETMKQELDGLSHGGHKVRLTVYPSDTHFSILRDRGGQVLQSLISCEERV